MVWLGLSGFVYWGSQVSAMDSCLLPGVGCSKRLKQNNGLPSYMAQGGLRVADCGIADCDVWIACCGRAGGNRNCAAVMRDVEAGMRLMELLIRHKTLSLPRRAHKHRRRRQSHAGSVVIVRLTDHSRGPTNKFGPDWPKNPSTLARA